MSIHEAPEWVPQEDEPMPADVYWYRTAEAYKVTNTYLRIVVQGAIADLESDRPRDHIAGALAASLESF